MQVVLASLVISVSLRPAVASIFTKQRLCRSQVSSSEPLCRDVLTGLLHLDSQEALEFETLNVQELLNGDQDVLSDAFKDVSVSLKVEKSPLLVVYDLEFLKVVAGGMAEEVYDYTWSTAAGSGVFMADDFEPQRCQSAQGGMFTQLMLAEVSSDEEKVSTLMDGGRVCGCIETGWGSSRYSSVKRSQLNCNAWPAVFRPGATVWASRHCPRLLGPSYSVYGLRGWRWEFQIKVTLEWMARKPSLQDHHPSIGKLERHFYLNWTTPEAYDEEFDFGFKILFSAPRSGSQPPDLSGRYHLLIPNNPALLPDPLPNKDGDVVSSLPSTAKWLEPAKARSLLVPSHMVDLTGKTCDTIGVSLFTWASETGPKPPGERRPSWIATEDFCSQVAGSCFRNQANDLFESDVERITANEKPLYLLSSAVLPDWSSDSPLLLSEIPELLHTNNASDDIDPSLLTPEWNPTVPRHIAWPTSIGHSTSLEVVLNATEIAWMAGSPQGAIDSLLLHTVDEAKEVQIIGVVRNTDVFAGRFSLGSSPCVPSDTEEESAPLYVSPISKTISSSRAELFVLAVNRPAEHETQEYQCQVRLYDAKGALIDKQDISVTFSARPAVLANHEEPYFSGAKTNVIVVQPPETMPPPSPSWLWGSGAPITPHVVTEFSWDTPACPCGWGNFWCITTNFAGCTQKLRNFLVALVTCIFILVLALACGPSLVTLCFKFFWWTTKFVRRRLTKIQAAAAKCERTDIVKIDVGAMREGVDENVNSGSTTSRTPHNAKETAMENLEAAVVPPTPYLPPFFWGMPVNLAAAIFKSKFGANDWLQGQDILAEYADHASLNSGSTLNSTFATRPTDSADTRSLQPTPRHRPPTGSVVSGQGRPSSAKSCRGRELVRPAMLIQQAADPRFITQDVLCEPLSDEEETTVPVRGFPRYLCWSPPRKKDTKKTPSLHYYPSYEHHSTRRASSSRMTSSRPVSKRSVASHRPTPPSRWESSVRNFKKLTSYTSVELAESMNSDDNTYSKQHRHHGATNHTITNTHRGNRRPVLVTNNQQHYMALSSNVRLTNMSKRGPADFITKPTPPRFDPRVSVITSHGGTDADMSRVPSNQDNNLLEPSTQGRGSLRSHTDPGSSTEESTFGSRGRV